jgi:hypothetical protein
MGEKIHVTTGDTLPKRVQRRIAHSAWRKAYGAGRKGREVRGQRTDDRRQKTEDR